MKARQQRPGRAPTGTRPESAAGRRAAAAPAAASRRRRAWAVALAVLVALLAAAVLQLARGRTPPGATRPRERLNLLLVTLDTARADHLGSYGYARARTPHLDRLAAEGVRFETVSTTAPITLPAHASLFTGLNPTRHGVRNNGNFYLPEHVPSLTPVLQQQGYRTAAFVSSFILDRRYGLARGFDSYDDRMEGASPQIVSLEAERRGDRTALQLSRWLDEHAAQAARDGGARPFFAWLHLYDPHEPYRPPPPFREIHAAAPYDGEIAFDDAIVASLRDKLGRLGLLERTLVAVTADHGESLGEHGEETHSMLLYEGVLRVPLILWRPGLLPAGKVITAPAGLIDVAPTLLDLLGAPALPDTDGHSLAGAIEGRAAVPPRALYAETYLPKFYMNWAPLRAMRDARFKFIDAPAPELYDLERDPREEHDLHGSDPQRAARLREALERVGGRADAMHVGSLDRETVEKLAALGYVGAAAGGADAPAGHDGALKNPREFIDVFNRLRRANTAVRERRFADALPILREVLAADPRNAFARLVMGSANMGMGRWREAIDWFGKYLELVPTSSYAHHWRAICQLRAGNRDEALREAAAALALDPRFSDARVLRGGVLASRGRYDEAVAELRQAVETDPAKPILRLDLAKVLAEAGRDAEAEAQYDALLKLQPDDPAALTGLAALEARRGDLGAAEATLRRALAKAPGDAQARANLARVLEQAGRRDEARAEWKRLASDGNVPPGLRQTAEKALAQLKP
jgi:arylsulfatase A-like enzyme/Flp pilus assembly protein TadD